MRMFCGYFGSGKTLAMTKKAAEAHQRGDFIISNYPTTVSNVVVETLEDFLQALKEVYIMKSSGKDICDLFPVKFNRKSKFKGHRTQRVTILLDEVGVYFTNTSYKQWEKPEFAFLMDFILQCRKLHVEIYGTVQHPGFADAKLRRITESWRIYKKPIAFLPFSLYREYVLAPDNPNPETPLDEIAKGFNWLGRQHAWELYDTYQLVSKSAISEDMQYYKLLKEKTEFPKYSGDTLRKMLYRHFPTFISWGRSFGRWFFEKLVSIKNRRESCAPKVAL